MKTFHPLLPLVMATVLLGSRSARADGWDDKIQKGKQQEHANETDEERDRRLRREQRDGPVVNPSRWFLFGSLGAIHQEESYLQAHPTPVLAVGPSFVFRLTDMTAIQARASFLLAPFASGSDFSGVCYAGNCVEREDDRGYVLFGSLEDITFRIVTSSSFFVGAGIMGGVVTTAHDPSGEIGGLIELGLRFGAQREIEVALRSALGSGDGNLFGHHALSVGWSPGFL